MAHGAVFDAGMVAHAADRLKKGDVTFAVEDQNVPNNFPHVLFLWRAILPGGSGKGREYFLKHLLGVENAVLNKENPFRPREIEWRAPAPEGKLDLLVTLEPRMSTSALYAGIALPSAGWYEMHDLKTADMHPFIHPFNPAVYPQWESRTNWEQFKSLAAAFSRLASDHLGILKEVVATPNARLEALARNGIRWRWVAKMAKFRQSPWRHPAETAGSGTSGKLLSIRYSRT